MPLTQDGPYAEMFLYSLGIIHENDGLGSAVVSHLRLTFAPLCKNIVDPWTATLLTKIWISLGSTDEKDGKTASYLYRAQHLERAWSKSLLNV